MNSPLYEGLGKIHKMNRKKKDEQRRQEKEQQREEKRIEREKMEEMRRQEEKAEERQEERTEDYQNFLNKIRTDIQKVDTKDFADAVLNPFDYSPIGEKLLDLYQRGKLQTEYLQQLEWYCPIGPQQASVVGSEIKKGCDKCLISQLYPLLFNSYFDRVIALSDLNENAFLFNVFYGIDRVQKTYQKTDSIRDGLQEKDIHLFQNIKSSPQWDVKEIKKGSSKPLVCLYYDDNHVLLSQTRIDSPKELQQKIENNSIDQYHFLKYLSSLETIDVKQSVVPFDVDAKAIFQEIENKSWKNDLMKTYDKTKDDAMLFKFITVLRQKNK